MVTLSGVFAGLVDSYLGATAQIIYQCTVCNKITERQIHCYKKTTPFSGIKWISNDMVNFTNTISAIVFIFFIRKLFL
jgi:uncharacterized membrane protein